MDYQLGYRLNNEIDAHIRRANQHRAKRAAIRKQAEKDIAAIRADGHKTIREFMADRPECVKRITRS